MDIKEIVSFVKEAWRLCIKKTSVLKAWTFYLNQELSIMTIHVDIAREWITDYM